MAQYIPKDALVAEIERRLHFDNNWIEGDKRWQKRTDGVSSAYYKTIGSKHACESILDFIDTIEAKDVDLTKEVANWKIDHQVYGMDEMFYDIAKHFFELGLSASHPITAEDRGTAEEIIINLKRVENDYRIDLTKEIEWVRNKAQKGEEV